MDGATDRFAELMSLEEHEIRLDVAALLIAAHARPDLDLAEEMAVLDRLAGGCPVATFEGVVGHVYGELGYGGDHEAFVDPRNSYLDEVVRRRHGLPITLSVLAMALAHRLDVPVVGVGMPVHFLVGDGLDADRFADPFGGGAVLDRAGCARLFRQLRGPEAHFDPAYLAPVGTFSIVERMLGNLRLMFAACHDRRGLLWTLRLRTFVPGVPPVERWELATGLAVKGDFMGAAAELERLGEATGGEAREDYARRAAALRARLN